MDEIDNIIIHSLRQIGCNIDEDCHSLSTFTPEELVETVSKCLLLIKPTLELPKTLPASMAQRFSVTTTIAEACVEIGFRGDIGYQTFLYSNIIEVRRVFMYLIERLPKESEKLPQPIPKDKLSALEREISENIRMQLGAAWTPQYCKKNGIAKCGNIIAVQSSKHAFLPQKLNIPRVACQDLQCSQELREYWIKRSPTVFQQTKSNSLCASLIHKNDIDRTQKNQNFVKLLKIISKPGTLASKVATVPSTSQNNRLSKEQIRNIKSVQQLTLNNIEIPNQNDIVSMPEISTVDSLIFDIEKMKQTIEQCVMNRSKLTLNINNLKETKANEEKNIGKLKDEKIIKERTHILLENPEVNMKQMRAVLAASENRMKQLEAQWDEHRIPLLDELETAQQSTSEQSSRSKHIMDQIKSTRHKANEIAEDLKHKMSIHAQLVGEFEKFNKNINRNDYTSRILEIIGNIRKQKTDIDKVLMDTRAIQKEINNISGQLDRQFTVTDDLLFKNAKRDEHTKKAYKLLATLHSDGKDLRALVQETGAIVREVRDIEEQIENEKVRNLALNLEKISADLKLVEKEGKELQEKLKKASELNANILATK